MSTASASRTIKFLHRVGALNANIQCNYGDLFQRYKGTPTAPQSVTPNFATIAQKPQLDFVVTSSRINASGNSLAEVSNFKAYVNGKQILFDSATKKSTGIQTGSSSTSTDFAGCFELVEPSGAQLYYGIKVIDNLVVPCAGVSPRITFEGKVSLNNVSETVGADYTISLAEQTGASDTLAVITAGNLNGFTITNSSGAGSTVILKAMAYDGDGTAITSGLSYEWYKLDPTVNGDNGPFAPLSGKTSQTLTVTAADVDNETEYKVIVRKGSSIIGSDVQKVSDTGDHLVIDPHPNPADETISDADGGNQSVTYTPAVMNIVNNAAEPGTWQFTFMLRDAAGVPLNTDYNTPNTSFTVTLAQCQQGGSDLSLLITAKSV